MKNIYWNFVVGVVECVWTGENNTNWYHTFLKKKNFFLGKFTKTRRTRMSKISFDLLASVPNSLANNANEHTHSIDVRQSSLTQVFMSMLYEKVGSFFFGSCIIIFSHKFYEKITNTHIHIYILTLERSKKFYFFFPNIIYKLPFLSSLHFTKINSPNSMLIALTLRIWISSKLDFDSWNWFK